MRPVRRGESPIDGDFNNYKDAKPYLVSRLGPYCSYCERKIATLLAVEHVEPQKGRFGKPELEKVWSNFLLACTNCNSTKSNKKVDFSQLLFPDRDNTFAAFNYLEDGTIAAADSLTTSQREAANNMLALVGLDKPMQIFRDENEQLIALDRVGQRMEAMATAEQVLEWFESSPNEAMIAMIIQMAKETGFFSIWMRVFDGHSVIKIRLINAFKGTQESGCFNMTTAEVIEPAPNPDELLAGSKI